MKKKILKFTFFIIVIVIITLGTTALYEFSSMRKIIISNSLKAGEEVENFSETAMKEEITSRLYATALGCAYTANAKLESLAGSVRVVADSATDIYNNPKEYGRTHVGKLTPNMIGKRGAQFVYAEGIDPDSPKVQEELSMIGNLKGNLAALYTQFPELAADYIGTKSGIMLLSGPILSERWDKDGNYNYLDPRERPWYKGAVKNNGTYFSGVTTDYDTGESTIMCSYPIYKDGDIVAVAGAGIYLEDIKRFMRNAKIVDTGAACIIDNEGSVIFSTNETGELELQKNILSYENENTALKEIVAKCNSGETDVESLTIDDEKCYAAFSPVSIVNWTFISIIPEKLVTEPTTELLSSLDLNREKETITVDYIIKRSIFVTFFILITVTLFAGFLANKLVDNITGPIRILTNKVERIGGDNLDFTWELESNDETEALALTFGSMTRRLKQYIIDNALMTAEKERITAELNVARDIQAAMLPNVFPPFPDRKDFDIYAQMHPAKEVGGDLYDFFLIDDDHLALTVADVSGKGVPASLFMMTTKTHLKNRILHGSKSPSEILYDVNNLLCEGNDMNLFVTVWLGIVTLSTGHVIASNAGHEYPVIMDSNGVFSLLKDRHGLPLAAVEDNVYGEYEFNLERNGGFFIYSDGVPEATDSSDELYGTDRMITALNSDSDNEPKKVIQRVENDVRFFYGDAPQFDDMTMMCFKWRG
ncbi:sigma-B regulation protein RsbU (phosphoserine phosphatase) [Lachnospiraceae bacterium]|nr:sigma-B regulation protein RsbU (phosphoserine phosphatase) [Lachnospiraceae bacterium]